MAFVRYRYRRLGEKLPLRPESVADHNGPARVFFLSMSEPEQRDRANVW
jgi:hypothetical protein